MNIRTIGLAAILSAAFVTAASAQEVKIGVFDFERVSAQTHEGRRIQSELKSFHERKQSELAQKEKDLRELQEQFLAQALSLAPERRAAMEKELQKKQSDLQIAREGAQREMQIEFNEARDQFQEFVVGTVEAFGREGGYSVIFETGQRVFHGAAVDITGQIVERINRMSPAPAGAAPEAKPSGP